MPQRSSAATAGCRRLATRSATLLLPAASQVSRHTPMSAYQRRHSEFRWSLVAYFAGVMLPCLLRICGAKAFVRQVRYVKNSAGYRFHFSDAVTIAFRFLRRSLRHWPPAFDMCHLLSLRPA